MHDGLYHSRGAQRIEQFAADAELVTPGVGDTVRSVLSGVADIAPSRDGTCQSVSLAYTFLGVATR